MKKNISINLQGLIFHIEDDGYDVLSRYLQEVKAHFASYQGHEEIVADIEGRIAELFAARLSVSKQVITLADVEEMTAKMGRVSDFATEPDEEDAAYAEPTAGPASGRAADPTPPLSGQAADGQPRRLYRDLAHRKIAGVCAGLAQYFRVNPLVVRLAFLALVLLPSVFSGFDQVPGLGMFQHRFDFSSLAFIAYVVLWIALPKRDDAPTPIDTLDFGGKLTGRKLFRDVDTGKVGGVAAGLAAYFRTDVVLVRVLFLLSAFLTFGSTIIVYIVLWVVVPEALTMSEKMQMRGDAFTLSGIDNNLRTNAFDTEGATPAGTRSVGTFLESAARQARPAASFLGTLIRWAVGGLLIVMGGSWVLGALMMLGAALSIIPFTAVEHTSNGFMFDNGFGELVRNLSPWGAAAWGLLIGIPGLGLLLLGLRLLLRRPVLGRSAGSVLLGLWLLGIVGATAAGLQAARNFQAKGSYTTTQRFAGLTGRGIGLDSRSLDENTKWVDLHVAPADSGTAPYLEEEFRASGRTEDAARLTAQQTMVYHVAQRDSTITFDEGFRLKDDAPGRNQHLALTLYLPLGKVYRLTPAFVQHLDDDDFTSGRRPTTDGDRAYRARFTREGKFACLDCPSTGDADDASDRADRDANDDDSDGDVVDLGLNGTKMRVRVNTDGDTPDLRISTEAPKFSTDPGHYGTGRKNLNSPDNFSEIETHGAFRVLVRQGDSYHVEAAGRSQDLDEVSLRVEGSRLVVRPRNRGFFSGFSFSSHPILVTVTLPRLRKLELNGACQADVSGFRNESLGLDVSGASFARLNVDVPNLDVNLSGASHADLRGSASNLTLDGSSASQVAGLGLRTEQATITLSGASQATVRATNNLTANLSGSSRARYAGKPGSIEKDLSGNSSLEEVRD